MKLDHDSQMMISCEGFVPRTRLDQDESLYTGRVVQNWCELVGTFYKMAYAV
jgi:hypothetical protein